MPMIDKQISHLYSQSISSISNINHVPIQFEDEAKMEDGDYRENFKKGPA